MITGNSGKITLSASLDDKMSAGLKALKAELDRLEKAFHAVELACKAQKTILQDQKTATNAATNAIVKENIAIKEVTNAIKNENQALKDEIALLKNNTAEEEKNRQGKEKLKTAVTTLGVAFTAMGAAITGAFGLAAKAAIDLDTGMIRVQKTTGLTDDEVKSLSEAFVELSTKIPISARELANIGAIAGQLGVPKRDILAFTEAIGMIASVTDLSVEAAAEGMARLANIFKIPYPEISRLGSVLNELENASTASSAELLDMMNRMGGAGKTLGLTATQVGAVAATLRDLGVQVEVAGTGMEQIFIKMVEKSDVFAKQAGVSISEWQRLIEVDALGALQKWILKFQELDTFSQIDALDKLGIDGTRVTGILLKLGESQDKLNQFLKIGEDAYRDNTSVQEEFKNMMEGVAAQGTVLWQNIQALGIEIGQKLLPIITSSFAYFKDWVQWFRDTDESTKNLVLVVGGIGGVGLSLVGVLLLVVPRIAETVTALVTLKTAIFGVTVATEASTAAFALSPITLIAAALLILEANFGLVSTAIYYLVEATKIVWEWLGKLWELTKNFIADLPIVGTLWTALGDIINAWNDSVKGADASVKNIKISTEEFNEAQRLGIDVAALRILKDVEHKASVETMNTALMGMKSSLEMATQAQKNDNKVIDEVIPKKKELTTAQEASRQATIQERLEIALKTATLLEDKAAIEKAKEALDAHLITVSAAKTGSAELSAALIIEKRNLAELELQTKAIKELEELRTAIKKEEPGIHKGITKDIYDDYVLYVGKIGEQEDILGSKHKEIIDAKELAETVFLERGEAAINTHIASIKKILDKAAEDEITIEDDKLFIILTNSRLSFEEREKQVEEYVKNVALQQNAVADLENELNGKAIDAAKDQWNKKSDEINLWYNNYVEKVNKTVEDEEKAAKLIKDAEQTKFDLFGKLQDDYDKAHSTWIDGLKSAWNDWSEDVKGKATSAYQVFKDILNASGTFFKEAFVAVITLDLERLGQAFADFANTLLQIFTETIAKIVAEWSLENLGIKAAIIALLNWLKDIFTETKEEIGETRRVLIETITLSMIPAITSLIGMWSGFNTQLALSNSLLSGMPGLGGTPGGIGGTPPIWGAINDILNLIGLGENGSGSGTPGTPPISGGNSGGGIGNILNIVLGGLSKIPGIGPFLLPVANALSQFTIGQEHGIGKGIAAGFATGGPWGAIVGAIGSLFGGGDERTSAQRRVDRVTQYERLALDAMQGGDMNEALRWLRDSMQIGQASSVIMPELQAAGQTGWFYSLLEMLTNSVNSPLLRGEGVIWREQWDQLKALNEQGRSFASDPGGFAGLLSQIMDMAKNADLIPTSAPPYPWWEVGRGGSGIAPAGVTGESQLIDAINVLTNAPLPRRRPTIGLPPTGDWIDIGSPPPGDFTNMIVGGFQHGLNYVPVDNFPARLHRGEAVITARGNEALSAIVAELKSGNNLLSGSGESGEIHVHLHLDGREITETVIQGIQKQGNVGRKFLPGRAIY